MAYAENTKVPIDRSQAEIKKILTKYKATGFAFAEYNGQATVMFEMSNRRVKFNLPLWPPPSKNATKVSINQYEQNCRSRWRALCLCIKAKLESVESEITTLENEFMAHIMLPDGKTVGQTISKQIEISYQTNKMPPLLGAPQ